ncbi:MAG: L-ribulose-5-phosphate 4-epimerase AraD [Gemmatimonadales bacterium]
MSDGLDDLRRAVLAANQAIARLGLARFTFGNASAVDRRAGRIVIKPSGVPYDELTPEAMVVTDLEGRVVEGTLRPSADLPTHAALYRAFTAIGGVVHTHSKFATVWAQARRDIPCYGTTHADHFHGAIPVTAELDEARIAHDYEANTGVAIVERFAGIEPLAMPAVLVAGHAPFCWGPTLSAAVENAAVLEEVAEMAYHTVVLNADAIEISRALHDKHFLRKHGAAAYYGQT